MASPFVGTGEMETIARRVLSNGSLSVAFALGLVLIVWWPSGVPQPLAESDNADWRDFIGASRVCLIISTILFCLYVYRAYKLRAWSNVYFGAFLVWGFVSILLSYYGIDSESSKQSRAMGLTNCLARAGDSLVAKGACYDAFGGGSDFPIGLVIVYSAFSFLVTALSVWALWRQRTHRREAENQTS